MHTHAHLLKLLVGRNLGSRCLPEHRLPVKPKPLRLRRVAVQLPGQSRLLRQHGHVQLQPHVAGVRELTQAEGLTGPDLLAAFVTRRVLPLQSRPHLICQMSGQLDPSRMCTKEMPREEVAYMVNYLAKSGSSARNRIAEPIRRLRYVLLVSFSLSSLCCRVPLSRF